MSAEAALQQILSMDGSQIPVTGEVLLDGKKMKNRYMRLFVDSLRKRNTSEAGIVTILLLIDEMIETGKAAEDIFDMLKQ